MHFRQRLSRTYGNSWKTVNEEGTLRIVMPSTGSRFELKIGEFSAVNHGGTFRCVANVDGYGSIKSKEFNVYSELSSPECGATDLYDAEKCNL